MSPEDWILVNLAENDQIPWDTTWEQLDISLLEQSGKNWLYDKTKPNKNAKTYKAKENKDARHHAVGHFPDYFNQ